MFLIARIKILDLNKASAKYVLLYFFNYLFNLKKWKSNSCCINHFPFFVLKFDLTADQRTTTQFKWWGRDKVKSEAKNTGHFQKLAINKKSTIFVLSSWNLVKMVTSYHQVKQEMWYFY